MHILYRYRWTFLIIKIIKFSACMDRSHITEQETENMGRLKSPSIP